VTNASRPVIPFPDMKTPNVTLLAAATVCLASCASSNEELQQRMDQRNSSYATFQERREIRTDARQERTDMWYDRVMH
jgi:hypothetical protein